MTDKEIMKALTEWSERAFTFCNVGMPEFARHILGLINRQQAEIERLQSILLKFVREINNFENKHNIDTSDFSPIPILEEEKNNLVKQIKAEAIKEFAERLKEERYVDDCWQDSDGGDLYSYSVYLWQIDNLVQEMVGDSLCL